MRGRYRAHTAVAYGSSWPTASLRCAVVALVDGWVAMGAVHIIRHSDPRRVRCVSLWTGKARRGGTSVELEVRGVPLGVPEVQIFRVRRARYARFIIINIRYTDTPHTLADVHRSAPRIAGCRAV